MSVKLLTEHHLEFLSLTEAAQARLSLHLSKCNIVGNHRSRLINCSHVDLVLIAKAINLVSDEHVHSLILTRISPARVNKD